MKDRFGVVEDEHVLIHSLAAHNLTPADIDVIVLSHLHFDHAGGLLTPYKDGAPLALVFPHARYVVSRPAWERAKNPHARDKASFIPELTALLEHADLELVDPLPTSGPLGQAHSKVLGPHYHLHLSEGHTPGLMLTEVALPDGPMVYAGDLIPGAPWVHLPITMGYDRYPERLIDEKAQLLSDLVQRNGRLFFTHDPTTPMGHVRFEAGRYSLAVG
jgi:glyoxylase-like metal-dependent hydrolase (beta-lactamase superfamily II)